MNAGTRLLSLIGLLVFSLSMKVHALEKSPWRYKVLDSTIEDDRFFYKVQATSSIDVCEEITMPQILTAFLAKMVANSIVEYKNIGTSTFEILYASKRGADTIHWRTKGTYSSTKMTSITDTRPMQLSGLAASLKKLRTDIYAQILNNKLQSVVLQEFHFDIPGFMPNSVFKGLASNEASNGFKDAMNGLYDLTLKVIEPECSGLNQ